MLDRDAVAGNHGIGEVAQIHGDDDARLAAYCRGKHVASVRQFFDRVLEADAGKRLHQLLFQRFSGPIRTLIENRFVFEPFWRALREHDSSDRWEQSFSAAKRVATMAVMSGDTATLLSVVMDRLYVLRNQLVHGGATFGSKVNRQHVADGVALLGDIVPLVLSLMLDAHTLDYGAIEYPVLPSA